MAIIVKGRNAVVSPAVKAYLEKKIDKVTRQFKAVGDITAVLKVENGNHIAEITVPAKGILLRAQESTKDMYSSIDLVVEKIERQVHKYNTKLMKRKYSNFREVPVETPPVAEAVPVQAEAEEDFKIIRSKSFTMNPMTPEEAILQMNLLNHDFFVFYDPDFGGVSVVYRRHGIHGKTLAANNLKIFFRFCLNRTRFRCRYSFHRDFPEVAVFPFH